MLMIIKHYSMAVTNSWLTRNWVIELCGMGYYNILSTKKNLNKSNCNVNISILKMF